MHIKLLPQTMTIDGIKFNNIQQTKNKNTSIGFCDKYVVKIEHTKHPRKLRSLSEEIEIIKYLNDKGCITCPQLNTEGRLSSGERYYIQERIYPAKGGTIADTVFSIIEQKGFGVCQGDYKPENLIFSNNGCCYIIDYDQAIMDDNFITMDTQSFIKWFNDYFVDRWKEFNAPDIYTMFKTTPEEVAGLFNNGSFNLAYSKLFSEQVTTDTETGIYHDLRTNVLFIEGARNLQERLDSLNQINFNPGERVLDVGCNMGLLCHYLHDRGCSPTGIDMDPKIILGAKMVANILGKNINYAYLDLDSGKIEEKFDTACLFSVIHHTKNMQQAAKNIAEQCRRIIIECALQENGHKAVNNTWEPTNKWDFSSISELTNYLETLFPGFIFNKHYGNVDRKRHIICLEKTQLHTAATTPSDKGFFTTPCKAPYINTDPNHQVVEIKNTTRSHCCSSSSSSSTTSTTDALSTYMKSIPPNNLVANTYTKNNFKDFTYAKKAHFELFKEYSDELYKQPVDSASCALKRYQDPLVFSFIKQEILKGSRILEIGGGKSRLSTVLKNDYEYWNLDRLSGEANFDYTSKGLGKGPLTIDSSGCRLVKDYIGYFNKNLPDNYFDFVFSISVLEHVPDDNPVYLMDVKNDINRVLKPGGLSLHCFDIIIKNGSVWTNKLLPFLFNNVKTINPFVPLESLQDDPELFVLSKKAYEKHWEKVTKRNYEDFGKPSSYNILWQKSAQAINKAQDQPPVLIYQMGKVGSSTILNSLKQCGFKNHIYHIHFLSEINIKRTEKAIRKSLSPKTPQHLKESVSVRQQIDNKSRRIKWKIITLVRDPIAQRISSIFENSNLLKGFNPSDKNTALEILENRILYHFNAFDEHTDIAASWFDNELKTVFDFDVYNVNFDKSRGYQIYHTENADILLLRLEDLNRCYKKAFKLFLGIDDLTLIKSNIGAEKKHHDLYERVKKDIVIPANDLKKVYQTKYSKHFYTTAEINNFTNKWSRGKSNNPNGIKAATKFPKISIVTPSFNQAEYLEECIDSILSQGYPNLEYIIMDGGSTDGSVEIIKKYEKHLTYWQSQPDGGQYNAVNEGFKRTTGDIMTWLNSDDYFQKDALKVAAAIFNSRQDISWIMCRPNGINSEGIPWVLTDLPLWHRQKYLQKEYRKPFIQQEGTFWKRSLWDRAGMTLQTDLQMAGDLELWARFFRHAQLHSVDVLLASYRSHPGQKAQTHMDIYISEADSILDREINHFENSSTRELMPAPNPVNFETVNNLTHEMFNIRINSNACLINAHGEKHLANGNTAAAIKSFFKACSLDPKNATTYSNLGLAYSATGNHKQSLQSFEKSIQLDPNNKTALLNISKVATTQNTEDQSISVHKTYNERNSAGIASQAAQFRTNSSLELQHDEHTLHAQTSDVYRVSAIISTYNSEEFITECLKDLVNQTLYKQGKLEIIVINSGSEQNEEIIVKDFQNKHINITYLQTERETLYAAWNRGINIAKGTYITNANTDDRHHPEALEIMAKELDNDQSIDLVYSNCKETSVAHQLFAEAPANTIYDYPPFFAPRSLLHYQFGPQPMWRKTIHAKIGYFDDSYFAVGDYEFNIRLALQCRAKLIPKVLGLFYKHDDSITSSYRHQHKEKQNLFTAFRNESTILQLYKKEGFKIKTSQEKATALNKMGFLALNYKKPWEETFTSDLEFSLYCFKHALPYDSSNQTIQYHINELMKVINKTDTLNLSKFTEDLSPNIQESQQSNDLSTSSKSHFLKKRLTVIAHRNNITFMDNIIPWFKENFDLHIANVDNQEEIRMVLAESDIVWVEWATKIAVQVSMMPRKGKLIVRLHSFEAFDNFPQKIAWENIDDVIFVANHIKDIAVSRVPSLHKKTRLHIIENSVDLDNFQFNNHSRGSKLAFVGAIRHAKNLPFLLQCFKAAYDMDSSLSLHIAGDYMDTSSALEVNELNVYIKHIINKLNLLNSVIFYGQVKDISGWLKDKDYIISTSIRESTAVNLLEAMAMGLKPVIHNFPAAEELYPKKYIFSDIEEFKQIIFSDDYSSEEYRSFVETHFSKNIQINKIRSLIHQYEEVAGTRHVCKNIHLQNINLPYSLENKFELINYANKQFEEAHQIKNRGHQLGMIEEAIKLLEKAHQIDPSDSSIARNIAMVYKKTGDLEKASLWQKKDLVANEL